MRPPPQDEMTSYRGRSLLTGKRALITGGDSGIGRVVAIAFAKEGADVAVGYLNEHEDARRTQQLVQAAGRRCLVLPGDLAAEWHCIELVTRTVEEFGGLDALVNHAGTQEPQESLSEISTEQWERTFRVNVTAMFWLTKAALAHLPDGAAIITTGSVNGLRGNKSLIDYAATKGAVHIPPEKTASFGQQVPLGRPAQTDEIAPSYVFLAAEQLSSYYTGQVLSPIGGETHPG